MRFELSRFRHQPVATTDWDQLARTCDILVAFIRAGLSPNVAWTAAGLDSRGSDRRGSDREGSELAGSAVGPASALEVAWRASVRVGAPLDVTVRHLRDAFSEFAEIERDVTVAIAGPRLASRIMLTLPAAGVLIAGALDLNPFSFLLASAPGWFCTAVGLVLVFVARGWSQRLISAVHVRDVPLGVLPAVIASGLSVGVGARLSTEAVDAECDAIGMSRVSNAHDLALSFANEWGIPLAGVVTAQAQMLRQSAVALVRARANELAERLLLPLAACILPAFILLSIVPIVAGLLEQSGIRWNAN